jgi:hypothetical protein
LSPRPRDPNGESELSSAERPSRRGFLQGLVGLGAFGAFRRSAAADVASSGDGPAALTPARGATPVLSVKGGPGFAFRKDLRLVGSLRGRGGPRSGRELLELSAVEVLDPEPGLGAWRLGDELSPRRREAVLEHVHALCCAVGLRMHVRFSGGDGLHFEPDGRAPRLRLEELRVGPR